MIRALLLMFLVGILGLVAAGLLFSILVPLLLLALKVAVVVLVGYFVLKLFRPDLAREYRARLLGECTGMERNGI